MATKKTRRKSTSADPATAYARGVTEGTIVAGPHVRASCARHLADLENTRGLVWDADAAQRALGFFPDVLRLSEGQFDGEPFRLHPSQEFIVGCLFGWKRADGARRFRRAYVEQGKGNGKALALDTKIPTPTGWVTMGALSVGDQVFDEHGSPCNVTGVTEVMSGHVCYRVTFSDGAEIIADADHIWKTSALRTGLPKGPKPKDAPRKGKPALRTTAEIAASLTLPATTSLHPQAKWNHRVDICGPVQFEARNLAVPPYTLGAWLGDGNTDDARLTNAYVDAEIIDNIRAEGVHVEERHTPSNSVGRYVMGGDRRQAERNVSIQARLRELGVLGCKHIPEEYLTASKDQRLAVLQGLMDTDGTVSVTGQSELTLCNNRLVEDAVRLIRSLGLKAKIKESEARLNGRSVGLRWRISFYAFSSLPVFRLARKLARQRPAPATKPLSEGRMIVGCDLVPSVPVRCISVDSPSRMYLAGEYFVPTHNSPLAGGIGLYGMMADREAGAQVFAAAAKMDQARILFNDAVGMVRQSPMLAARITPTGLNPVNNLADMATGSYFRPVGRDTGKTGSGLRPHFVLLDELHEHPNRDTLEMLERGFKFRRQPLILMITNSGSDRNSVCWEEHEHAVKVAHGEADDDSTFSYVCALDEGEDPLDDPSCWVKANPLMGVTLRETYLADVAAQAKAIPGKANSIRRLHFCQWTDSESAWIARDTWEACEDVGMALEDFEGKECWLGLDLGATKDMTARCMVFRDGDTDDGRPKFALFAHGYTPAETLTARARQDRAPYDGWVEQGHLTATPGKVIRLDYVAADLVALSERFEILAVAYDRWLIRSFEQALDELGVTLPLVEHPQGTNRRKDSPLWMPESIDTFENLLLERRLRIAVNPALRSAVMSTAFWSSPAGLRRFEKQRATGRIDLAVAAAMGIGAATSMEEQPVAEPRIRFFA